MMQLRNEGCRNSEIEGRLEMSNVGKYLSGRKKSFITHIRHEHDRLGTPRHGYQWLPMLLRPRGTPDKTWIQVPVMIRDYSEITSVLAQLEPTRESFEIMRQFNFVRLEDLVKDRANLFGFLLGVMLGDAIKPMKGTSRFPSMTVALTLSKARANGFKFGEFTALCANTAVGLRMHRIKDAAKSEFRFTDSECYRWLSPASPLFAWVFRVCLGLRKGEKTTTHPLRMEWLLQAPREFRIHFLQGLAESDGWVDAGADRVKVVSSPNERLLSDLFAGFNIPFKIFRQSSITRIEIKTEDGLALPIFNTKLQSNYFNELLTMAKAKNFPVRKPLPEWFLTKIRPILSTNSVYSQACLEIARTTGYKIHTETVKKYTARAKQENPARSR